MGAGTYYTHPCNKQRAAWIDFDHDENEEYDADDYDQHRFWEEDIEEMINDILESNGYRGMENGLVKISLVPKYYGDGLIIQLDPAMDEWESSYNLFLANFDRIERRIHKLLSKHFTLRIATSGYTSAELVV
jgi:hypothetical protein